MIRFLCSDRSAHWRTLSLVVVFLGLNACAWNAPLPAPAAPPVASPSHAARSASTGASIARHALDMIGTPYRFGGANEHGFDCSGLVQYAHRRAGLTVPRTAAQQSSAAQPVRQHELQAGDLVFFRVGKKIAHVGIYIDGGRFVHAPSTGRNVTIARMDSGYYAKRLAGTGRFYENDSVRRP